MNSDFQNRKQVDLLQTIFFPLEFLVQSFVNYKQ